MKVRDEEDARGDMKNTTSVFNENRKFYLKLMQELKQYNMKCV